MEEIQFIDDDFDLAPVRANLNTFKPMAWDAV